MYFYGGDESLPVHPKEDKHKCKCFEMSEKIIELMNCAIESIDATCISVQVSDTGDDE